VCVAASSSSGACVESSVSVPVDDEIVKSPSRSVIDDSSSRRPVGASKRTSTKPRPLMSPAATLSVSRGPASDEAGVIGGRFGAANSTSWPDASRKPIFRRPLIVNTRTWSGMSARNSTVTSPCVTRERSAYRRPLTLMLSFAKLSFPTIRSLPSVEIFTTTWPLNTACEVKSE
jgi:hypothetical protein